MIVLAIDCSAVCASVAILKEERIVAESFVNNALTHSQTLLPMIDYTLKSAGISIEQVDKIAITNGPGSFTGLRIGLATVKGLCAGRDIDCVCVSTLLALSHNVESDCVVCACMDARRNQVYNALFRIKNKKVTRLCEDRAVSAESSPMFIWHTAEDKVVPVIGSLLLAEALTRLGACYKLSIYPYGPHGVALSNDITKCGREDFVQPLAAGWTAEADEWLKTL